MAERDSKRLAAWKSQCMFKGWFTLLTSSLALLLNYFLSLFLIPLGIVQQIKMVRRRFLWGTRRGEGKKYIGFGGIDGVFL